MKLKYIIPAVCLLGICGFDSEAAELAAGDKPGSVLNFQINDIALDGSRLDISTTLDFSKVNLQRNREMVCTPMLVNGNDTLRFESFTVSGRNRFYYAIRNGQPTPMVFKGWSSDRGELSRQSLTSEYTPSGVSAQLVSLTKPIANINYSARYQDWMEEAILMVDVQNRGCHNCNRQEEVYGLAVTDFVPRVYEAEFVYVTPVAEAVKTREVSGRAYIDFKVNQTVILPDYRNNTKELAKITATIDSVKNDKDITVTSLGISGTASPEGSYANNVKLAKGRTEALAEYVRKLYSFPKGFIKESYEPVDWKGLAEWLDANGASLDNSDKILAIVNGDLPPEQRNAQIKKQFPKQYNWLLENVYPSLRHSDYNIEFTIRTYTQVDEIIEVMRTQPQKLSLAELFVAASAQPEGSPLYTEAFELAVRMYPSDPAANLNAGIAAMKSGNYEQAQKYLAKAGNIDEAKYARAVLTALQGNEQEALQMFRQLTSSQVPSVANAARSAESQLAAKVNFKGNFTTL